MAAEDSKVRDRAGTSYWDCYWGGVESAGMIDPDTPGLDNHMVRMTHRFLSSVLEAVPGRDDKILLEAGCGGSRWLPYFSRRFGFRVAGLDYSEPGCQAARRNLETTGVEGEVVRADLFAPPQQLRESADVVFSAGLAEHFTPTEKAVCALADLTRPGGMVITMVPNMRGLSGLVQRLADREVYDGHVPLSSRALAEAHSKSGLSVESLGYLGTINLGIVNLERLRGGRWYAALTRLLSWASKLCWILERAGLPSLPNLLTSPTVYCVARKPLQR